MTAAPSEGVWYFLAKAFMSGALLYKDLQLTQQPAFVVVNAAGLSLFGETYLEQKLIFVLVLFAYIYCAYRLTQNISLHPTGRAILLLSFFMCGIHFEAYRFDDYYALLGLLAMLLVLTLGDARHTSTNSIGRTCIAGLLVGLATLTRINDGLALFLAVVLILCLRNTRNLAWQILSFLSSACATVALSLFALGESPTLWLDFTILNAIGLKGGTSVFSAPFILFKNSASYILFEAGLPIWGLLIGLIGIAIWQQAVLKKGPVFLKTASCCLILGLFITRALYLKDVDLLITAAAGVFILGSLLVVVRATQFITARPTNNLPFGDLLLIPMALYASGAMSSGGYHYGLYFPLALTLLVTAMSASRVHWNTLMGTFALIIAAESAIFGFFYRFENPYSWHSYRAAALSEPRITLNTQGIGLVPMTADLKSFITPICELITESDGELLSLPFPYANYICGKQPWKGYVQTFFDLTSSQKIKKLIQELKTEPPRYIFYQRQLDNLTAHEKLFNAGAALPQRDLDHFLMERSSSGFWQIVHTSKFGEGNTWILIDTTPK